MHRNRKKDKRVFVLRVLSGTLPTRKFYSKQVDRFITPDFANRFHAKIKGWNSLYGLRSSMECGLAERLDGVHYRVEETLSNIIGA